MRMLVLGLHEQLDLLQRGSYPHPFLLHHLQHSLYLLREVAHSINIKHLETAQPQQSHTLQQLVVNMYMS